MRVLLVNPPSEYSDTFYDSLKSTPHLYPPLGLAYIAGVLEKKGYEVKIFDGQLGDIYELENVLAEFKPGIIGMSTLTPTLHRAVFTAKKIKEDYKIPIIIGGPHATSLPLKTLKDHEEFDFAVVGEGEYTFLELIEHLDSKKELKDVKGIAYREGNKILMNEKREHIQNLDEIPFPARHLLPHFEKYSERSSNYKRMPGTIMISSRGCPNNCIFCDHPFGKINRTHSIKRVIEEIKHLQKGYGIRDIHFADENLMLRRERLKGFCNELINKNIELTWSCFGRCDNPDLEVLRLMKKAGCWFISYGIESGNQEVLNFIKKGTTLENIRKTIEYTKEAKIQVKGSFMLGHPIDTYKTIRETINFAKELPLDYVSFAITVPYPGSELYEIADNYGEFRKEDFKTFKRQDKKTLSFVPKGFTEADLLRYLKQARREFYFRPNFVLRSVKNIRNWSNFKRFTIGGFSVLLDNLKRWGR